MPLLLVAFLAALVACVAVSTQPPAAAELCLAGLPTSHHAWYALAAVLAVAMAIRAPSAAAPRRAAAELLLVFASLLCTRWLGTPAGRWPLAYCAVLGAGLAAVLLCLWRDPGGATALGLRSHGFAAAARALAWPTLLMAAIIIAAALAIGPRNDPTGLVQSFLTYPVWALAQLVVFLAFAAPRFALLTTSRPHAVLATALLFGLAHWPNELLAGLTTVGMLVWGTVYLRHQNLYATALSMGTVATLVSQLLPFHVTTGMRTGPSLALHRLRSRPPAAVAHELASAGNVPFTDFLYQRFLGRPPTPPERSLWSAMVAATDAPRATAAFLRSFDLQRGFGVGGPELRALRPLRSGDRESFLRGFVDGWSIRDGTLTLAGWAGDTVTGAVPVALLVFLDGALVHRGAPTSDRPDVAGLFRQPGLLRCGFRFALPLNPPPGPGQHELRVFALPPGDGIAADLEVYE